MKYILTSVLILTSILSIFLGIKVVQISIQNNQIIEESMKAIELLQKENDKSYTLGFYDGGYCFTKYNSQTEARKDKRCLDGITRILSTIIRTP